MAHYYKVQILDITKIEKAPRYLASHYLEEEKTKEIK